MGSLDIQTIRSKYPGKSDADAAKAFAQKHGYIVIVRYKNSSSAPDFTNIGTCQAEDQIQGYLRSPYCHNAEVIYDGRSTALRITNDLILKGHCELCGKQTTQNSLQLMAGNDFYICPKCGSMFCDSCYVRLPVTSSPGYGVCSKCRVKVQRAIPGFYGEQSGITNWTRKGKTYEESDREYAAKLAPNIKFMRVFSWSDFIKDNETGTFTVCVFEGEAHLVAKISVPQDDDSRILVESIKAGRFILQASFYPYPTYPVIYNRIFIVTGEGTQPGNFKGVLVESAANFAEANFQQWAVTLRGTKQLCIHVYTETNEELAIGETEIALEVMNMVIHAIDRANEFLKSIPEHQQNFQEAVQAFFLDHPKPFLFDTNQENVGCEKNIDEEQKQNHQPFSTSPEQSKTSRYQDDLNDATKTLVLLERIGNAKSLGPISLQPDLRLKLSMPLYIRCLVFIVTLMAIFGIIITLVTINIGTIIIITIIGGIIGITIIGIGGYFLVQGVNYLIETQDLRQAKRDEKNAERAKRERENNQIQLNKNAREIAKKIERQLRLQKPLESILPKICTKSKYYEPIAKAISSLDSLKSTEKGRLFNNMPPDAISHILNYFNDTEKITILQQLEQSKRNDVLMRFSLSKRHQLGFTLPLVDEQKAEKDRKAAEAIRDRTLEAYNAFVNKVFADIVAKRYTCNNCGNTTCGYKLSSGLREATSHVFKSKSLIICRKCGHVVDVCSDKFKEPNKN